MGSVNCETPVSRESPIFLLIRNLLHVSDLFSVIILRVGDNCNVICNLLSVESTFDRVDARIWLIHQNITNVSLMIKFSKKNYTPVYGMIYRFDYEIQYKRC